VVYGAVIVLAVLFMPRGLLGLWDKVVGGGSGMGIRKALGDVTRFRRAS
jgi:hypothetical protein